MARIAVIRQGSFTLDPRVRREVAALADAGHDVDVICLRRPGEPRRERLGRITVHRLRVPVQRAGPFAYVAWYACFGLMAAGYATLLGARRRWQLVQVNSLPDALVFAALGPRLLGARVLLDLHEVMPEFFATKYGVAPAHPLVRVVARAEQASIRFADAAITCTDQMRDAFVARGADRRRIDVILNAADEDVFDPERFPPRGSRPDRFTLLCHGSLEERYGVDTLLRAAALLRDEIPELRVEIYGDGSERGALLELARRLGIAQRIRFSDGFVPIERLLDAIAGADVGVVAMRRDAFRDLTHCNKMFDYIAMRRPAIVSRTRSVEEYFDGTCFQLFEGGDEHDLAHAIRALHADPALAERLVRRAAEVAEPYRWARQRERYRAAVERLLAPRARRRRERPAEATTAGSA